MDDEKKERTFNCLADMEMPALGFHAIAAVQAGASRKNGDEDDSLCCVCTAMVMLHGAAASVVAHDVKDPIERDEFLRLAGVMFDAHNGLSPERLEKMRVFYTRAVARGLFERKVRAAVQQSAAEAVDQATNTSKARMN